MLKVMAKRPIFSEITNLDNSDKRKGKSINAKHSSLFTCCTCLKCLPVGLFKASENKELVSPFGKKCIVLSEVFSSLGFPLDVVSMKDKECCMPCTRSLITVSLKMSKLTKNLQKTTAPPHQPRQLSSPGQKRIRSQISSGLSPFKKAGRSEISTESIQLVSECRQLAFSNGSGNQQGLALLVKVELMLVRFMIQQVSLFLALYSCLWSQNKQQLEWNKDWKWT